VFGFESPWFWGGVVGWGGLLLGGLGGGGGVFLFVVGEVCVLGRFFGFFVVGGFWGFGGGGLICWVVFVFLGGVVFCGCFFFRPGLPFLFFPFISRFPHVTRPRWCSFHYLFDVFRSHLFFFFFPRLRSPFCWTSLTSCGYSVCSFSDPFLFSVVFFSPPFSPAFFTP